MTILDADKDPEGSGDSPWSSKPPLSILYNPANSSEYIYIQKNGLDQSEASIQVTWLALTNERPVLGSNDLSTANQRQEREGLKAKIGEGRPTAVSTGVTIFPPIKTIFILDLDWLEKWKDWKIQHSPPIDLKSVVLCIFKNMAQDKLTSQLVLLERSQSSFAEYLPMRMIAGLVAKTVFADLFCSRDHFSCLRISTESHQSRLNWLLHVKEPDSRDSKGIS